jgi:two-component system response regulator FixJ
MQPPAGGIFLLDPDEEFHARVLGHCAEHGLRARCFRAAEPFFEALEIYQPRCIILAMELEDSCGLEIQAHLANCGYRIPVIFAARQADPAAVVRAIKGGAQDFLVKPVAMEVLCEQVQAALESACTDDECERRKQQLRKRMLTLTQREQEVLALALTGKSNKEISARLDISPRTVESHRSRVLDKIGLNNLLELAHIFADENPRLPGSRADDGSGKLQ